MKSVMTHQFGIMPQANVPRSSFNRSHGCKTTFDAGYLVPVYADEALPGDTFNMNMSYFARLATPIAPVMDNMYLDSFFFAVPLRLIWDNWEKFNGAQDDPDDSTDYIVPVIPSGSGVTSQSLSDYLGIPVGVGSITFASFWHRAYNLIWNEWFRDQNLQDSLTVDTGDGPDTLSNYTLQKRGKRHDYFTSCLPFAQKADPVSLSLGDTAPIKTDSAIDTTSLTIATPNQSDPFKRLDSSGGVLITEASSTSTSANLVADLASATASTINEIREAFQIQKLYERDARGGTRYTEIIKSHFGVTSPDARLQRPEYLGGSSSPINISPIAQTSSTDTTTPQGNLAAIGTSSSHGAGFNKSFTEHCVIIGLVSARADLTYQQGLNRMFSRSTRFDFYWPALSHIGEQAVLNKEIYATSSTSVNNTVFGYQERYAEYKYKPSIITGKFRSIDADDLDVWHLSQNFAGVPLLNNSFIQEDPPVDRIIATPDEPHFLFDSYFDLKCARPMPVYSIPGKVDHF
ncbi:major capsid protein [Microviridae sp.]|nr:major capsid protein [Microviridae sp.]